MSERILLYAVKAPIVAIRADKLLADQFDDVSRARIQKAFASGNVTFDETVIDKRYKINRPGVLRATLEAINVEAAPKPVTIPLEVVYEDKDLIAINKAPGMVTHPGNGTGEDTLVHALLYHCGSNLSSVGAPLRPGIVHRLDKETSGLIVAAKTDLAHHRLAAAFSDRETDKYYTAIVSGRPRVASGSIRGSIARHPVVRTKMAVVEKGKTAHTDWEVLNRYPSEATCVICRIFTGRTHQIRVHMSSIGHPLLGDRTYGYSTSRLPNIEIPRVLLHSTILELPHPRTGERIRFEAPLPKDLLQVMEALAV